MTDRVRAAELLRLALRGGRTDRLRIGLTAFAAALVTVFGLAACVVASMPGPWFSDGYRERYRLLVVNDPNLRAGVVFALILMTLPPLALAAQAARIGAPARERRLAAYRLAGASARQVRWVAALEAGVAAVLGVVVGVLGYAVLAAVLNSVTPPAQGWVAYGPVADAAAYPGQRYLPTDVVPHWWLVVPALLLVPVVVVLLARRGLRRADPIGGRATGPVGVSSAAGTAAIAAALVVIGLGFSAAVRWVNGVFVEGPGTVVPVIVLGPFALLEAVLAALLLVRLGRATALAAGRVLTGRATGAAALIAGRRLRADPGRAAGRSATLILATVVAGVALALRGDLRPGQSYAMPPEFYLQAFDAVLALLVLAVAVAALGILVTAAEAVVGRRRELATLVAAGVPRRTLAASLAVEDLAPVLPALVVAMVLGLVVPRAVLPGLGGGPILWGWAAAFVAVAAAAGAVGTALSLLFLPASTDIAEARAT